MTDTENPRTPSFYKERLDALVDLPLPPSNLDDTGLLVHPSLEGDRPQSVFAIRILFPRFRFGLVGLHDRIPRPVEGSLGNTGHRA